MKRILTFLAAALALLVSHASAQADFQVKISGTNLTTSTFSDPTQSSFSQNMATVPPGPGTTTGWSGSLNFTSTPFFPGGSPGKTTIDMSGSVGYAGSTLPAQIVIELTRTDFSLSQVGDATLMSVLHALSVSDGVTVTLQSFVNYGTGGNQLYAEAGIGGPAAIGLSNGGNGLISTTGLQSLVGPLDSGITTSAKLEHAVPNSDLDKPYSVTERLVINFSASGGVVSLDAGETVSNPAPAGFVLAVTAMPVLGFGAWLRRRGLRATL
jgi:hypothetical protein